MGMRSGRLVTTLTRGGRKTSFRAGLEGAGAELVGKALVYYAAGFLGKGKVRGWFGCRRTIGAVWS